MQPSDTPALPSGDDQPRLAVLIDADNAQPSVIEGLLAEVAKFGVAGVKRIYGDWTSTKHVQWKESLLEHSITPIQQFAYTTGKNATDSSMIIDAMDLMYGHRLDGFCLVSSDSDFARSRKGCARPAWWWYGFGERKTPKAFVVACDKFVYTEVLRKETPTIERGPSNHPVVSRIRTGGIGIFRGPRGGGVRPGGDLESAEIRPSPQSASFPRRSNRGADESGWAHLGFVGNYLTKVQPDFDPRLYGCRKLSDLLRKHPGEFETSERGPPGSSSKTMYARVVAQKDAAKRAV